MIVVIMVEYSIVDSGLSGLGDRRNEAASETVHSHCRGGGFAMVCNGQSLYF